MPTGAGSATPAFSCPIALTQRLTRIPDLGEALRDAEPSVKRQVFTAFDLEIAYDKPQRRVELSADALQNAETLLAEGSDVVVRDIAGARFVSRYDARIVERARLPA